MATQTKIPPLTVSNPWWGHDPSDKQWLGLYGYEECPDLFYGGAAGPGKTSFLLMAAVQYVHYPHYRALILRKTYADLSLPDAIMDRAISWWDGVEGARFNNQEKACYFPSGAKITFGYLASVRDHLRYQGAAVHFVGIDEASQIPSRQLEYLHSRIRRARGDPIPLRYRLASNPGDVSHDWLKDTYVNGADGFSVVYLPGLMTDNPGLDVEEYRKQLAHLDPVTRRQLEEGDWDVQLSGGVLDVTKLKYFTSGEFGQRVRYWDFAATEQKEGVDPDWTAGVLMGVEDGEYQVQDVQRFRVGPAEVEVRVKAQAQIDGPSVPVRIEQEPGSAGVTLERVDRHCREVGALALYYDAGGSGASIRTNLRQVWREQQLPQYPVFGVNFGAAVEGANTEFVRGQTNAQYFARRNAQLGWTLRLRATRTKRLTEGEDIDLGTCLVINPAIDVLEGFLAQLAQPEYDETSTGKVEIAKGPKDAPNPDLFDAACLAVSHDSRPSGPASLWVTTSIPGSKIVSTLPGPSLESRKARRAGEPSELVVTTSISRSVAIVITVCLTASTIGSNHAA